MKGVKNIAGIEESGPLVHLDKHHLPDLEDLMLDVWAWAFGREPEIAYDERYSWVAEDGSTVEGGGDLPTHIPNGWPHRTEAAVGYYRKNPCVCGDGHSFDMFELETDDEGNPVGSASRGAFLGVYFP
jgi:hypothetical protein